MDVFGIGAAMRGAMAVLLRCQRATGRSTMLLSLVQPGDEIIFADNRQANHFERALHQKNPELAKYVRARVVPLEQMDKLRGLRNPNGRVMFDHVWVERFYQDSLDRAIREVQYMQEKMSGQPLPVPARDLRWEGL